MAEEENTTTMNLDLNLGPVDNNNSGEEDTVPPIHSYPVGAMNLQDWLDSPARSRHRNHRWRSLWRQIPITPETRDLALELIAPENGEASNEAAKTLEEDDGNKKDSEENNHCEEEGSFFDCNICLDMSKDPVVTCCGHLFCWTCLYRWLHHHSDAKECPVCKGEVTAKNVTPIYGRGNNNNNNNNNNNSTSARVANADSSLKIPLRPQARRVESWRQAIQRSAFTIPMEEMIRRLGSTFDLSRERSQVQSQDLDGPTSDDSPGINNNNNSSLLNRILTSRGLRRERAPLADDVIDLTAEDNNNNNNTNNNNTNNNNNNNYSTNRRISSMLLRRSSSHRATSLSNLASALQSAESLAAVESYFNNSPVDGEQGRGPHVDDRDSVSSIAAVIQSESQTVDNTVEIDSRVSLSTSSSRRRVDASRISDVDSGDSRAPRRRRLN